MRFNVCIIRQNRIKMAEAYNRLFDLVSEDDISELIKEIQIKIQIGNEVRKWKYKNTNKIPCFSYVLKIIV